MNTAYKILTESATVFGADGYIQSRGVTVCDQGETIAIGMTEHHKDDLTIDIGKDETIITSINGWSVYYDSPRVVETSMKTISQIRKELDEMNAALTCV